MSGSGNWLGTRGEGAGRAVAEQGEVVTVTWGKPNIMEFDGKGGGNDMDEKGGKQRPGQKDAIGRARAQAAKLGVTSLHEAVRKGDEEVARGLLLQRADPNARDVYGMTPLHIAAIEGHADILRLLLYSGAKPECENVGGFTAAQLTKRQDIRAILDRAAAGGKKPSGHVW